MKKAASSTMGTVSSLDTSRAEETTRECVLIKVGMHVLGTAATDPRVMREATALIEAGYAVSIVDIEEIGNQSARRRSSRRQLEACLDAPCIFLYAL